MISAIEEDRLTWAYDLQARQAFITRENINDLIGAAGFSGEIGLLSIDLDGNDYWVWEALEAVSPILCVCEYNAVFGDVYPIATPYDPAFRRTNAHFSALYFGASIAALCFLAGKKGYRFVGTTTAANDAFFVREDYAARFVDGALGTIEALPSRLRESRNEKGELTFIRAVDRLTAISHLPVVNVETGGTAILRDLNDIYSAEWLAAMCGAPSQR